MKKLLLLHGALGSQAQFSGLKDTLKNDFEPLAFNFSGHGGEPFADDFSIERFAEEILFFLHEQRIEKIDLFGYSMGGYAALHFVRLFPERVGKIMTLATKFDWSPDIAAREVKMLDPEKIEAKLPAFAQALQERHAPNDWKMLLQKTAHMMLRLGNENLLNVENLAQIPHPVLVCLGDSDLMVSPAETQRAAEALPNGQLLVLEQTPHLLEKMEVEKLAEVLRSFF